VMLRAPSSIVPDEYNYLINPAHPDFARIEIGTPEGLSMHSRLLR
jgi:RES domain-containing protein